jgi:hypothetical protein
MNFMKFKANATPAGMQQNDPPEAASTNARWMPIKDKTS